ncbi:MAG: sulfurtransferase complex subunit TusC [Nitrospinota bacterium]
MGEEEKKAKVLFVMRKPPHGSIFVYEGLEVMLIFAAYDQEVNAVFIDDGVLALKKGQDTAGIGLKGFAQTFRVLEDYGIEHLWVDRESLEERGLTVDDLVTDVEVLEKDEIVKIMKTQVAILPF